jgi:hypothetical protein
MLVWVDWILHFSQFVLFYLEVCLVELYWLEEKLVPGPLRLPQIVSIPETM